MSCICSYAYNSQTVKAMLWHSKGLTLSYSF